MNSDEAMTPEGSPTRKEERHRKLKPSSSGAAAKSKKAKKRSKRRRKQSSSSSSSSSESLRSSRSSNKRRSKENVGWSTKEVLDMFNTFQKHKGKDIFNNNLVNNVIPEFDPSSKTQNMDCWLRKVNECSVIYEWNERQTIHFALQKLSGQAKKWYGALPSVVFSWSEWQDKLLKAFPDEQNYGRLLEEMLARTTRGSESLREYFYDKLTLLNRCEIRGKKAVDCIIHGILDKSIRNSAQTLTCREPEDLLNFLSSQRLVLENNIFNKKRSDIVRPGNTATTSTESSVTCFNCRSKGHPYFRCPKPLIKCLKCQRVGHNNDNCKLEPLNLRNEPKQADNQDRKILTISTFNNNSDKFYKNVTVNDKCLIAFIDFGSECSLIRESDAQSLNLNKNLTELPVIKGFGNSKVFPIYKSNIDLKLDEVEVNVEVLVVSNQFLQSALLIGQNVTELPSVTVFKNSHQLIFYQSPDTETMIQPVKCLKLNIQNDTNIGLSGLVEVTTSEAGYCGDIYIEGYCNCEPNKEHYLHQGVFRVVDGKCCLPITNLSGQNLTLPKKRPIAKGTCLVERSTTYTNRITKDSTEYEPLLITDIKVGPQIDKETLSRLHSLLLNYRDCFAFKLGEIGCANSIEMKIDLLDDKPVVYRPYRLSFSERGQVREIVDDLLQNDIIQESDSNYASPIILVRKKTGEQRLCVDYRALNNKTRKDCFPLPIIDDQLTNLSGNRFFTSLDLASGYYQVPMAKESRPLTAFVTPDGHYEFKRMPFGLANAPAVFQRFMNAMLGSKRHESALAYLDDILVPSVTLEEGFERLESVFKLLRQNGLTLKLSKCRFFDNSLDYLGYEISAEGIRPNENKILAVKEFPVPQNVHEIRQFLGLAGYFRKFVRSFGEIARPLTNLLKKGNAFKWTDDESNSFNTLKDKLTDRPILALYNINFETELHTDASSLGVGGILMQWQPEPRALKPIAYFSRQTTPEERHLHSYELETLAIVCSLKKFRVYLLGIEFKIVTDCNALRTTLTKRDLIPRIARWWLLISEFNFSIEYRPGIRMAHVDALSRNTKLTPEDIDSSTVTVYSIETDSWLLTLQITDPDISRIYKILKPESDEEAKDIRKKYVVKNSRVYRRVDDRLCLVIPRNARWQICKSNHDDAGHLGVSKTTERIQSVFWFPKLRRFVKKYVKSCIKCAYNKDNMLRHKSGQLYPIEKVSIPFHTIHIDHLGPFVKSKNGNAYILTIVDGFTKYLFVRAVKDTKTKTTVKVLLNVFYDFGLPSRIISDRGTSFTSAAFKSFCDTHGVKHVLNAVACPRANGQAERYNQTILSSLAKYSDGEDERNWDMSLGKIQWGINNSINSTTQKTATEALFGTRLRDSLSNLLDVNNEINPNLTEVRQEVLANIESSQAKQKQKYDQNRIPAPTYKAGDLIKITRTNFNNKGNSTKLMSKFIGPYKIAEVLGNDRYKIVDIPGFSKRKNKFDSVVAVDRIRPWISINMVNKNDDVEPVANSSSSSDSESNNSDNELPQSQPEQK